MTPRPCERTGRRRRPVRLASTLLALVALGACSSSKAAPATTAATTRAPSTTARPATTAPASTAADSIASARPESPQAAPTTTAAVDGPAVLAAAFAALSSGYHFDQTATVGGQVVLQAQGDRVGAATRLSLTQNGATVAYLITPEGSFASTQAGAWDALDTPPATADPITALGKPSSVSVTSADGTSTNLAVVVPGEALGMQGAGDQTLAVVVTGGAITDITWSAPAGGQPATVHAVISPIVDTTPITAPVTLTT